MFCSPRLLLPAALLATALLATAALAQRPGQPLARSERSSQWIVHAKPSAALGDARQARLAAARAQIRAGTPAPHLATELRELAAAASADLASTLVATGHRIDRRLVMPPALVVTLDATTRQTIATRPDVARLEPVQQFVGNTGEAAGPANHNAGTVHNVLGFRGHQQTLALVDSGVELRFLGGALPHPAFTDATGSSRVVRTWSSQGGTLSQLTDQNGHGTGVGAVAIGRRWAPGLAADGFAPAAALASYRVTTGTSTQTTNVDLAQAYGEILLDVIGGLRIGVVNCSFSGSPDPTAIDQRALDELALYADVLPVTSAGKLSLPPNFDFHPTAQSQAVTNGLAVGAVSKGTHEVSAFSAFGPLAGDGGRSYPDLVAVGENVHVADRTSNGTVIVNGTSYSAPMVAGTALLLREARPDLDAIAIKAILLGTTNDVRGQNPGRTEQHFGQGLLRSDRAVRAAIAARTGFQPADPDAAMLATGSLAASDRATISVDLPADLTLSATLVWLRTVTTSPDSDDLGLDVLSPTGDLLARGNRPRNLYERVVFTTKVAGAHEFVVRASHVLGNDAKWTLFVNRADGRPATPSVTPLGGGCAGSGRDVDGHVVLPQGAATGFGGSRTNKPLADVPLVLQAAYDVGQLTVPQTIRALGLRRAQQEGATPALGVQLRVTLGYTNRAPDALSSQLATNFVASPPPSVAFDGWLALPPTSPVPAVDDFDFVVPLAAGWTLDPSHGNVLVQLEVLGNDRGNLPLPLGLDAVEVLTGTTRGALVQFTGSPFALPIEQRPVLAFLGDAPRGQSPRLTLGDPARIATATNVTLLDARESTLAMLAFGTGKNWGSLPLPLDLLPWGAPDCTLVAHPEEIGFVITDATGQATVELTLPADPQLVGTSRDVQFLIFDPSANAGGLVTSPGLRLLFGS
ncbi:MAG: S8/S53 family peptidase [bacterium]|nr:S8/S53 family peptidase [bacterium]